MEPSETSFFVRLRGLPWSATREDIVNFLKNVKLCDGNTAVLFTVAEGGKKSGEAVVAVQEKEDQEKALQHNRDYIGKRWVEVVDATYQDFCDILAKMAPKDNEFVVRMRGLPYAATSADIKQFFDGVEIVENGILVVTDDQGRCGGEAYVEFTDASATQTALLRHRNKMGNRFIEVFRSTKGEMVYVGTAKATPLMSINTRQRHPEAALGGIKRSHNVRDHAVDRRFGGDSPEYQIFSKYSFEKFIHLRNLPFNCTENDIVGIFAPIQVISLSMICDDNGKFTGMADAYFETDSDAIRALNENRGRIGRRPLDLCIRNRKVFVLGRMNPQHSSDSFGEKSFRRNSNNFYDYPEYSGPSRDYEPPIHVPPVQNYSTAVERPVYPDSSFNEPQKMYPSGYDVPPVRPLGRPQNPLYPYDNPTSVIDYAEDHPNRQFNTSEEIGPKHKQTKNFFNYFP